MKCKNCNKEFNGRKGAKFCSDKCRVTFNRNSSVTNNRNIADSVTDNSSQDVTDKVVLDKPVVTDNFEYRVKDSRAKGGVDDKVYSVKYWYQVPLGAVPVIKKGFPEMPEYMNGRQYFLWWKNNFKTSKQGAVIYNPYKQYDNVQYVQAGETSRRWGA